MSRGAALTLENSRYLSKPVEADRLVRVLQEMIDMPSAAT
jgi:YesN/AraC family two-component response regulator